MEQRKLGNLLIVDDEAELMTALCEMLTLKGYQTTGFTSGAKALTALSDHQFDLLLTDLMMPGMDGIALLRAAAEMDRHLVGIIMTGQGTVESAVEAMKTGAFDYILKPFKLQALLPVLNRAMQVHFLRQENVQLRETVAIYELATTIAYTLDVTTLLNKTADAALEQLDADEVSIMLPTSAGDELYVAAARGERQERILGERVPLGHGIAGWVASRKEPLILTGKLDDLRFAPLYPRTDISSALSVPMLVGGELVGVLNVNSTRRRGRFSLGQVKALNILANTAGAGLQSALLFSQVRQAEDKFRCIFQNASEGIFQTTPDGRFLTVNPALAQILGYDSPEEVLTVTHWESRADAQSRAEFSRVMERQGCVLGFESQVRRKDGSLIWVAENVRTVRDEQGAVVHYEGTMEDITPRKQAEQRIQRQFEYLLALRAIDQAIIGSTDLRFMLKTILAQITQQLHVDAASVRLLRPEMNTLELVEALGFRKVFDRPTLIRLGEGCAGLAVIERRIISISNTEEAEGPFVQSDPLYGEGFAAVFAVPLIAKGQVKGVLDICHRAPLAVDAEWLGLMEALAAQTAIAIDNVTLFESLQRSIVDLSLAYETTLEGWSAALDLRDKETEGHTRRVAEITVRLARAMAMTEGEIVHVHRGALLHDIGKMAVPDAVLLKPGPLTEDEWVIMRKHPEHGMQMLSPIAHLRPAIDIPYCHHEKWDGTGYPRGLAGEQIPFPARIFAVVDVYDALRSERPYRKASLEEDVCQYLREQSGKHFDPKVADAFLGIIGNETNGPRPSPASQPLVLNVVPAPRYRT